MGMNGIQIHRLDEYEEGTRDGYRSGAADAALVVLAPALGFPAPTGPGRPAEHTLFGRRFRLSVEWLDEPPSHDLLAKAIASARGRAERSGRHG